MKATIVFYPNQQKKGTRTESIPIYMRIIYRRQKTEARLFVEIPDSKLSLWDTLTMRLHERNSAVNHYLNRIDQKFQDFMIYHAERLPVFSVADIKNHLAGNGDSKNISVIKYVDDFFTNAVVNNVNKRPGTVKNYRRAVNHLTAFLKARKLEALLMDQFKIETANDFKNYLVSSDPVSDRMGMAEVSAATVIKKFRTIFSQASDEELIKINPFKKVKIKTKSPRRERLTVEQVEKICQLELAFFQYLPIYRDIFLFSVYTGLAYHDIMSLTWANIEVKQDGNYKLSISRTKTDVITECFLPQQAIDIAIKYKKTVEAEIANRVFPYRSNKEMNCQLKVLAQLAAIPIRLTTHIARHTFRQLIAEAGITDYGVIKRMMGQSRNGDVDEVYYSITEKGLIDAKNKLEKVLAFNNEDN